MILLGFPYGNAGELIGQGPWTADGSFTSPLMSAGPDASGNWILASLNDGTHSDVAQRPFTLPGLTTELTVEFTHYYEPTVGSQRTVFSIYTTGFDTVIAIYLKYSGTGSGSITQGNLEDNSHDSGDQAITLPAGVNNAIKVTWDGVNATLYVNGIMQFTWPHPVTTPFNTAAKAEVRLDWTTGFGSNIYAKDFSLAAEIL